MTIKTTEEIWDDLSIHSQQALEFVDSKMRSVQAYEIRKLKWIDLGWLKEQIEETYVEGFKKCWNVTEFRDELLRRLKGGEPHG